MSLLGRWKHCQVSAAAPLIADPRFEYSNIKLATQRPPIWCLKVPVSPPAESVDGGVGTSDAMDIDKDEPGFWRHRIPVAPLRSIHRKPFEGTWVVNLQVKDCGPDMRGGIDKHNITTVYKNTTAEYNGWLEKQNGCVQHMKKERENKIDPDRNRKGWENLEIIGQLRII